MITREDKLAHFINELGDIKDEKLRQFAEELIAGADDYFFTVPASSSGKYHPTFDLGNGGLIRHTRCVAFFARSMAESMAFSEQDTDLVIIAALAHDIKKQGNGTGYTVREHPLLGKQYIMEMQTQFPKLITKKNAEKVANAVYSHMGKWENHPEFVKGKEPYPMPSNDFEKALQAADYVASRKEILDFSFRPTDAKAIVSEVPTNDYAPYTGAPGDFVINFGSKYKGKNMTIRQIHEAERAANPGRSTYIEWMAGQPDFKCADAQDCAKRYLNELAQGPAVVNVAASAPAVNVSSSYSTDQDDLPF